MRRLADASCHQEPRAEQQERSGDFWGWVMHRWPTSWLLSMGPLKFFHARHCGAVSRGGFNLCSLYCIMGIGLSARANVDLLEKAGMFLGALQRPWVLCKDGNDQLAQLQATG